MIVVLIIVGIIAYIGIGILAGAIGVRWYDQDDDFITGLIVLLWPLALPFALLWAAGEWVLNLTNRLASWSNR